jgi:hypothetical protein
MIISHSAFGRPFNRAPTEGIAIEEYISNCSIISADDSPFLRQIVQRTHNEERAVQRRKARLAIRVAPLLTVGRAATTKGS